MKDLKEEPREKERKMTITEGLKRMKRITEDLMPRNMQDITEYCALLDNRKPHFESAEEQRKRVRGLIQSNLDLASEYLRIKKLVDWTNMTTKADFGGKTYTLAELLVLKRKLGTAIVSTYRALNDSRARRELSGINSRDSQGKEVRIETFYKEDEKNAGIRHWGDLLADIDARLETINATTELVSETDIVENFIQKQK